MYADMSSSYNEQELIQMLQLCESEFGQCTPRLFAGMEETCSVEMLIDEFGSWRNAMSTAGIGVDRVQSDRPGRPQAYTDEEIISQLQAIQKQYGKCTTELLGNQEDMVAPSVVIERFGSWLDAKAAAGITRDERGTNARPKEYSDKELLEYLRECAEKHGAVTKRTFNADESFPSADTVISRFGTWSDAKTLADLEVSKNAVRYSREELLEMVRSCASRYEKCTSDRFAGDDDYCALATIQRRFGTWYRAKNLAGIVDRTDPITLEVQEDVDGELYIELDDTTMERLGEKIMEDLPIER